jgi:cytidylate kinase
LEALVKVITISRSHGSGGSQFARQLADASGFHYADETFIRQIEQNVENSSPLLSSIEDEVGPGFLEKLSGLMDNRSFYRIALSLCLYELALKSDVVIVGAGAHLIFVDYPSLVSLQIVKKLSDRVRSVAYERNLTVDDALELIEDKDKGKAKWIKNYFDKELFDPLQFHMAINLSLIPAEKALNLVAPFGTALFEGIAGDISGAWLKNRLLEKKAEMVLFHLGLTHGPMIEFHADNGRLTVKGIVGGKHEKEKLVEGLRKMSEVTSVVDELRVEVLSRMLY